MDCIEFCDVSFTYPDDEDIVDTEGQIVKSQPIFEHFSGKIPSGFTSLIGPNGSGKSTFLLLASGRLLPQNGHCLLFGRKIASLNETEKNLCASVIYQNMEFESGDSVFELLTQVYKAGNFKGTARGVLSENTTSHDLLDECIENFELSSILNHRLIELSKGEIQRVLLAFSLLYGSVAIFMDEPLFAMEEKQKEKALSYLRTFHEKTNTAIFISMHELDLTRKFAKEVLLFYPDRTIAYGTPEEVMTDTDLEKAYGVPVSMLKHKENMTREELSQIAEAALSMQKTLDS